jgi:hypothetical protein
VQGGAVEDVVLKDEIVGCGAVLLKDLARAKKMVV